MNISISNDFNTGYLNSISGLGSETINADGSIVNLKSPQGLNNGAMKQWFVAVNPGDEVEFEVLARCIKGDARISVDLIEKDGTFTSGYYWEKINSDDFRKYKRKIMIPFGKQYSILGLVMGTWNSISDDSESEFMIPKINVKSAVGTSQVIACGRLIVQDGSARLDSWYKRFGVKSVSYSDTTKKVTIALERTMRLTFYPMIHLTPNLISPYIPVAGDWNPDTNSIEVGLSNGTTLLSMASGWYTIYFEVKV